MDDLNLKRIDKPDIEKYMGTKKDSYGMKDTTIKFDPKAKKTSADRLWYWTRIVSRNVDAENGHLTPNTNSAWRAINNDIINRQAGIKKHPESDIIDDINVGRPLKSFSDFK